MYRCVLSIVVEKIVKELVKKETKASENQVSLQLYVYFNDSVCTHVHVYACAPNYMYGK